MQHLWQQASDESEETFEFCATFANETVVTCVAPPRGHHFSLTKRELIGQKSGIFTRQVPPPEEAELGQQVGSKGSPT